MNPDIIIPRELGSADKSQNAKKNEKNSDENSPNLKGLDYMNHKFKKSRGKVICSDGYYSVEHSALVITVGEKKMKSIRAEIEEEIKSDGVSENQVNIEYKGSKLKTLKLKSVSSLIKDQNEEKKDNESDEDIESKTNLKPGHSDFYVLSWNVLLQHFNVVSNSTQVRKDLRKSVV